MRFHARTRRFALCTGFPGLSRFAVFAWLALITGFALLLTGLPLFPGLAVFALLSRRGPFALLLSLRLALARRLGGRLVVAALVVVLVAFIEIVVVAVVAVVALIALASPGVLTVVVLLVLRLPLFLPGAHLRDDTVVVVRVLHVIFGLNALALLLRLTREIRVFFQQLQRIATLARLHAAIANFTTTLTLGTRIAAPTTPTGLLPIPHEILFSPILPAEPTVVVQDTRFARVGPEATAKRFCLS